jgi:integrase
MQATADSPRRLRGLIVILWRAGLRSHEALALAEADLDQRRGAVLMRRGKGGGRREVGIDAPGDGPNRSPGSRPGCSFPSGRSAAS